MAEQNEIILQVASKLDQLNDTGITYNRIGGNRFSIRLDLSRFYNGVLERSAEPIQTLFNSNEINLFRTILTTGIPLLSDFEQVRPFLNRDDNPDSISLRDLFQIAAEALGIELNFGLLDHITNFQTFVDSIQDTGETVELGIVEVDSAGNIINQLNNLNLLTGSSLNLPSGFNIPLLRNPRETLFNIVSGGETDIFTYELPPLELDNVGYDASIPIIGPLGVTVGGSFTLKALLEFGYDLRGFYISDNVDEETDQPEFSLAASPEFGPALTIAGASVDVTAGISGGLDFNLRDENNDQKIRLNEIDLSEPSSVFDNPTVNLGFDLGGSVKVLGTPLWDENFAGIELEVGEIPPEVIDAISRLRPVIDRAIDLARYYYDPTLLLRQAPELIIKGVNYLFDAANQFSRWVDNAVGETVQQLQNVGDATIREVSQAGEKIWDAAGNVGEYLSDGVQRLWDTAGNTFENLANGTRRVWDAAGNTVETLANGVERLWDTAGNTFEYLDGQFKKGWNAAGRLINKAGQLVNEAGELVNEAGELINEAGEVIGEFFGGIFSLSSSEGGIFSLSSSEGGPPPKPTEPEKPAKPAPLNVNFIEISSDAPTSVDILGFSDIYYRKDIINLNEVYASDPDGYQDLARIDFFLQSPDGSTRKIGEATEFTPWETDPNWGRTNFSIDLNGLSLGNYTLTAKAYDIEGQGSELYSKNFSIVNQIPTPLDFEFDSVYGRYFKPIVAQKESLRLSGIAGDLDGLEDLARVDFYLRGYDANNVEQIYDLADAIRFSPSDGDSSSANFNASLFFRNVPVGSYDLVAVTYDLQGGSRRSLDATYNYQRW